MRLARPALAIASALTLIASALGVTALSAGATDLVTPSITQFPLPTGDQGPGAIATGADGNLWFTQSGTSVLGIATVGGRITAGPALRGRAQDLALDSGGNLWATEESAGYIARIPSSGPPAEFAVGGAPDQIAAGPDGNLWFTDLAAPGAIKRITPAGTVTSYTTGLTPSSTPTGVAAGPDGGVWFTESVGGRIGRIDPTTKAITEYSVGLTPLSLATVITAGPDGNLWFTETAGGRIGRITPSGTITEFSAGLAAGSLPEGIAAGPDGNLWFADAANPARIGRITPSGAITEFSSGLLPSSAPVGIAAGPDGNLWFTAPGNRGSIGRVVPASASAPTPPPATTTAVTGAASALTATSATVTGIVGPGATTTAYHFDWGTTAAYGGRAPAADATADSSPDGVSAGLSGLQPATVYHYRLVATTCGGCQGGTAYGADATFTTPAAPVAPVDPAPPAPKLTSASVGRTAVAGVVSGTVLVRTPGSTALRPLAADTDVPVGSLIDASRGVLHITTALNRHGRMQTATVWGGAFIVGQQAAASAHGMTTFTLAGPLSCPARGARAHALAVTARVAAKRPLRSLWASDNHGQYTTRGQNSVATVRGTNWETVDTCAGTLTYVKRGVVAVRDLHRHRTVVVRAGHRYLARR